MGPLDKYILSDDALTATPTGFNLQLRSHWYRSLPLSCMNIKAKVDGNPIDENNIAIEVNGKSFAFREMPELYDEWLFIQDAATLKVKNPISLEPGREYDVQVDFGLYIPYILVGPEATPLLAISSVSKKLTCG